MHLSENQLRAVHDASLPEAERSLAARHLADCPTCRESLARIDQTAGWVQARLSRLESGPVVPPARARARLDMKIEKLNKENFPMKNRFRTLALPILAVVAILILFAVPSVRAAAIDFLGLFRVQQIEVVSFNPANLPDNMQSSLMDYEALLSDQITFTDGGEPVEVASSREASAMAGFTVRVPAGLEGYRLTYQPASSAEIRVDLAVWQALLDQVGRADLVLPSELDGETITIRIPNSVTLVSGDCEAEEGLEQASAPAHQLDCLVLVQMPSPSIEAPAGLPVDQIGQIFLQFFGMSAADAERFSRQIDWSTTLVLPVPNTADYDEVSVNGVSGIRFSARFDSGTSSHDLIWIENGVVHSLMLNGEYPPNRVIAIAESLR